MIVEGPADNTFSLVRKLVGATKVDDAEPGTIRGDFATITTENLVHASDGHESAAREIALWFPEPLGQASPVTGVSPACTIVDHHGPPHADRDRRRGDRAALARTM